MSTTMVSQWAKSPKKQSVGVRFRQHGTVFQVLINKNALLQTVFPEILSTEIELERFVLNICELAFQNCVCRYFD